MPKLNLAATVEVWGILRDIRDLSDHELIARISMTRLQSAAALLDERARRDLARYRTNGVGWKEHLAAIPQEVLCRLAYRSELHFYYREIERRNGVEAGAAEARAQPARPAEDQAVEAGARPSSPKVKSFEDLVGRWEQLRTAEAEAHASNQASILHCSDAINARRGLERHVREALASHGAILVGEVLYRNGPVGIERIPVRLGGLVPWPSPDDAKQA